MTEPERPQDGREKTIREHTLTLHLIGDQLTQIESWFWQHLADVRESARTTANNPPTSRDAANNPLQEQIYEAMKAKYLNNAIDTGQLSPRQQLESLAESVLSVVERETAQLRAERDMALAAVAEARGGVNRVRAALTGEFMAGPGAVMVVRVDAVRAALEPKEAA